MGVAAGESSGGATSRSMLGNFARCAVRLTPEELAIAHQLVARDSDAAAVADDACARDHGPHPLEHELRVLIRSERAALADDAPAFARHAARLRLERRCRHAGAGVGSERHEAARMAEEVKAMLKETPRALLATDAEPEASAVRRAHANLRVVLVELQRFEATGGIE